MELNIISPTLNKKFSISWIEVETSLGNFVIKPGHAPMILLLLPNREVTLFLTTGKIETLQVPGGILEVSRTHAKLLINE